MLLCTWDGWLPAATVPEPSRRGAPGCHGPGTGCRAAWEGLANPPFPTAIPSARVQLVLVILQLLFSGFLWTVPYLIMYLRNNKECIFFEEEWFLEGTFCSLSDNELDYF